jgi:acyl-CoA synthetase (AMP-forming)/AMP-acid ligase II
MYVPRNLGAVIDPSLDAAKTALIGIALGDGPDEKSAREYSYGQLDAMADGVARALTRRGYAQGSRIAILAANSVPYVAAVLGIMRAGLVAVPVNFKFPPALIAYVLRDSGAELVFHDHERKLAVPPEFDTVALEHDAGFDAFLDAGEFKAVQPAGDDVTAMMLYTSGSTGKPKGVLLSHASHLWIVQTRRKATPLDDERALIAAPLYHMNAMALILLSLACHATTVLMPQFKAADYLQAIVHYRCTWLTAVPPMMAMMLQERELLKHADLSSVRAVRMGSAPVSASLLKAIHGLLPNAKVINAYGTTEGGPVVFGPHPQGLPTPPMSVGVAHPAVTVRLDRGPEDGPDQGVLSMKSPGVMLGYHQRPDVSNPIGADGFYYTGDVFRRDADGFYFFVGRRDDMFVSGGENIYPGEVEKMLESHPAVDQAVVVPVDDDIKGTKPVAFVVLRAGHALDAETLKQYALANAAAYQHPRHIWFLDHLPLASTNKIDRGALRKDAEARIAAS